MLTALSPSYVITVNGRRDLPTLKETPANVGNDSTDSDGVYDPALDLVKILINGPAFGATSANNDFGFVPVISVGACFLCVCWLVLAHP